MFSGKARRRREIFGDFTLKIVDFMKKIDQNQAKIPQNFLSAFGANPLLTRGGGGTLNRVDL